MSSGDAELRNRHRSGPRIVRVASSGYKEVVVAASTAAIGSKNHLATIEPDRGPPIPIGTVHLVHRARRLDGLAVHSDAHHKNVRDGLGRSAIEVKLSPRGAARTLV